MNFANLKLFLLDIFFPNRCCLCGEIIKWNEHYCLSCYDNLPFVGDEICYNCGNNIESCCCGRKSLYYDRCFPAFYYEGTAKSAVIYLKHVKNTIVPKIVAEKIYSDIANANENIKYDYIVPIPMTKHKLRSRGFNQAEVLAEAFSEKFSVPVNTDILKKNVDIIAQHNLSSEFREINVNKLYSIKSSGVNLKGKNILLCDDVITTGSTANKCSELLKEMGAENVTIIVAATTI